MARDGGGNLADLGANLGRHVVIRTRFFDDYLIDAAAAGVGQVVLLAAGLDTRAFRLPWPDDVRVFELDLPEVLTFKAQVLSRSGGAPRCVRTVLPVDLCSDWRGALAEAGHDLGGPPPGCLRGCSSI